MGYFEIFAKEKLGYTEDDLQLRSDETTEYGAQKFKNEELDILHTVWMGAICHVSDKQVSGQSSLDQYKTA